MPKSVAEKTIMLNAPLDEDCRVCAQLNAPAVVTRIRPSFGSEKCLGRATMESGQWYSGSLDHRIG